LNEFDEIMNAGEAATKNLPRRRCEANGNGRRWNNNGRFGKNDGNEGTGDGSIESRWRLLVKEFLNPATHAA